MCHCTNEIYYSNGLTQSQCHKKIPLAGLMDSAVSTAMDPACQRRANVRPAADNRSSYLDTPRCLCYHNFVLYYILYYTIFCIILYFVLYHNFVRSGAHGIKSRNSVLLFRYYTTISCALAHMESKVETVSFCFDIIP